MEKLVWCGYQTVKKFWRYVYSFWHDPRTWQRDGQMVGRTDTAWLHRPRLCIALHGKNHTTTSKRQDRKPIQFMTGSSAIAERLHDASCKMILLRKALFESPSIVSYSHFIATMTVSLDVCEIFSVNKWRDLENCFRGCSVVLFETIYNFLLVSNCKYRLILYHFRVIWNLD